ncbi:MAG: N-methyl-L-tryptophan oxidase [Gemmatimonadetes bacterium]|nr:N-methyl-L-tryptophan oxidase [Gemmatimonadota bacterium]
MDYDVAVVGLGAMGAAAAAELARRGARVLGLDRHEPPHTYGSSHGETRIIREAYFEHPLYVPLVRRAYELWRDLERKAGQPLLRVTTVLTAGPPQGVLVQGALASARAHDLPYEELSAHEVARRFPGLRPPADMVAILDPRAGALFAEACVTALHAAARRHGADLRTGLAVQRIDPRAGRVTLATDGESFTAPAVVLAAGAWTPRLWPALTPLLEVERQVSAWYPAASAARLYAADRCPIVLWEYAPTRLFYTFPDLGSGMKAGIHHEGTITNPDTVQRTVSPRDTDRLGQLVGRFLPGATTAPTRTAVCLYTNTPDQHFLIDALPASGGARIVFASACSGHGFKFVPALAEIVADLVEEKTPAFDIAPFRLARFASSAPEKPL